MRRLGILALLLTLSLPAGAAELMMARSIARFPETMAFMQGALTDAGYRIAHIQQVDVGLQAAGYPTAPYRVIFFGDKGEIDTLLKRYPYLAPYLPWKLTLFAEGEQTLVVSIHPQELIELFPALRTEASILRLERNLRDIFVRLRRLD